MRNLLLVFLGLFLKVTDNLVPKHNGVKKVASNALIKMSSIGITAISGKAGGSVYSRNRGGEYVKNFVMPTNTFSEARQAVRAVFGAISSGWRQLGQNDRNTWIEAAPLYLRTNAFGDQKQLSPNALYVGQNQNLANADLPLINTIGAPEGTNAVVSVNSAPVFDIGAGETFDFTFDLELSNVLPANEYVLEVTPAHNASKKNVENLFRKFKTTAGDGTTPSVQTVSESDFAADGNTLIQDYFAKYGEPAQGELVSFRVKAVNPNTGEVSVYWQESVMVTST